MMYKVNVLRSSRSLPPLSLLTRQGKLTSLLSGTPKVLSSSFVRRIGGSYRATKQTGKVQRNSLKILQAYNSTVFHRRPDSHVLLNKKIMSLRTVEELLKLFRTVSDSVNMVNKVTILHNIAKIVLNDGRQRQVLERKREKSLQEQRCAYKDLLDSISTDVSKCKPRHLSNVMWALGKIQEKDLNLIQDCEKEILSRDISSFGNSHDLCQVMIGCSSLGLKKSEIFSKVEKAILDEKLPVSGIENREMIGILMSFSQTGNGSVKLFEYFQEEILSRIDKAFTCTSLELAGFVWSFAKRGIYPDDLFSKVEDEILGRGRSDFQALDVRMMWAFARAGKGSRKLFSSFDNEIVSRSLQKLKHYDLVQIVWSFAKSDMKEAQAFDLVEKEVLHRSISEFNNRELLKLLWSFVKAGKHSQQLIKTVLDEMCSRDLKLIDNGDMSLLAWCGKGTEMVNHKLFDAIEQVMVHRDPSSLTIPQLCALMRGFIEAKRGSKELFNHLETSLVTRDIEKLKTEQITELLWCYSQAGFERGSVELFQILEETGH